MPIFRLVLQDGHDGRRATIISEACLIIVKFVHQLFGGSAVVHERRGLFNDPPDSLEASCGLLTLLLPLQSFLYGDLDGRGHGLAVPLRQGARQPVSLFVFDAQRHRFLPLDYPVQIPCFFLSSQNRDNR